jgi:dTDP-glucose pyrophosphorylase
MNSKKLLKLMEVKSDETIINCIKIINNTHKEFVYVVNKKKQLIGILTDADVRRAILKKKELKDSIKGIFNKNPKFAYKNDKLTKIDKIFKKNKINFLPIVDKNKNVVDFLEIHKHRELMNSQIVFPKNHEIPKTLIIMAGGKGLRLRPLTKNKPKPLIKITNKKSLLEYNIDHFLNQGIEKIYILTHYLSHKINIKIKQRKSYKDKVLIVKENKQMGTVGGISLLNKKNINFPAIVINGDIVSDINLKSFHNFHTMNKNDLTIALKQISSQSNFGEVLIKNFKIENIEEKKIRTNFINAGIYCLGSKIFKILKSKKKKVDMDFLIKEAVKKNYRVGGYPMLEFWMDIGNRKNLDIIRNILKKKNQ